MTAGPSGTPVDTGRPHPARVHDYLLGGKDHYPVDQALGEQVPEPAKVGVAQNRAFMHRSAGWAARAGIDQCLDIGTGITLQPRDRAEVARFFDGLDMVDPGLVPAPRWHNGTPPPETLDATDTIHAGVGRVR
ncbi:SAM-dependent methyltransferase [Streptomyces sp. NPDC008163]|uniref:SAM-dependent methyltransferase n=1 Tax=Streptomyces sp. NPDC008163 TaxID=3364818 RepID=UPI0036EE3D2A